LRRDLGLIMVIALGSHGRDRSAVAGLPGTMYVAALRIFTGPWTLPSVAVVEARILVEVVHLIACCGVNLTVLELHTFHPRHDLHAVDLAHTIVLHRLEGELDRCVI